jgi:hypothetical protein
MDAIDMCISNQAHNCRQVLLSHGADPNDRLKPIEPSALGHAILHEDFEAIAILVWAGADTRAEAIFPDSEYRKWAMSSFSEPTVPVNFPDNLLPYS